MNLMGIVLAAAVVGGTGIFIGIFLGLAGKKFAVEVDEKEEAILAALPGNNCGGCGYPGCAGLAAAIAKGEAPVGQCPVGGPPVASDIAQIMGEALEDQEKKVAYVKCAGTCEKSNKDYQYYGIEDCTMMKYVQNGGPKTCNFGCLGYGSCVKACPFDAIHIVDGVAMVDKEACKACKKCISVCPQNLIELVPYSQKYMVRCNNQEKGKTVIAACNAGCIGCKMCERVCEHDAIHVEGNIAHIEVDKCTNCGACAEKCPRKIIQINGPQVKVS